MKKLFFLFMLLTVNAEAKKITLDIPDSDIAIVENDVLDAEQWLKDAWAGKLNKCRSRMIEAEIKKSIENGEAIPAGDAAIVNKAFSRPEYKNRKKREESIK